MFLFLGVVSVLCAMSLMLAFGIVISGCSESIREIRLTVKEKKEPISKLIMKPRALMSTPNYELAKLRGCKEAECLWVWDSKDFANKPMSVGLARFNAREINILL